jgi:hypothetical protein
MRVKFSAIVKTAGVAFLAALMICPLIASSAEPALQKSPPSNTKGSNLDVKNNAENGPMKGPKQRNKKLSGKSKSRAAGAVRQRDNTASDKNIGDPPAATTSAN